MHPTDAPDPGALLIGAAAPRSRPAESRAAIEEALRTAPSDPDIRLAAYRFYFYTHDHEAALEQAEVLLRHAARQLNIPSDWRAVTAGDAAFTTQTYGPGLYLQALVALGYCAARTGRMDVARAALSKAAALDPSDRFGGAWLLGKLDGPETD